MKFSKWKLVPLILALAALISLAQVKSETEKKQTEDLPRAHPFSSTNFPVTE